MIRLNFTSFSTIQKISVIKRVGIIQSLIVSIYLELISSVSSLHKHNKSAYSPCVLIYNREISAVILTLSVSVKLFTSELRCVWARKTFCPGPPQKVACRKPWFVLTEIQKWPKLNSLLLLFQQTIDWLSICFDVCRNISDSAMSTVKTRNCCLIGCVVNTSFLYNHLTLEYYRWFGTFQSGFKYHCYHQLRFLLSTFIKVLEMNFGIFPPFIL